MFTIVIETKRYIVVNAYLCVRICRGFWDIYPRTKSTYKPRKFTLIQTPKGLHSRISQEREKIEPFSTFSPNLPFSKQSAAKFRIEF